MAVTFSWRSDTSTGDARFGYNTTPYVSPEMTYVSMTSALGGNAFTCDNTGGCLSFSGVNNFGSGAASGGAFSINCRFAPTYTPNGANFESALFGFGVGPGQSSSLVFYLRNTYLLFMRAYYNGSSIAGNYATAFTTTGLNIFQDLTIVGHLDDSAGSIVTYIDGSIFHSGVGEINLFPGFDGNTIKALTLGLAGVRKTEYSFNEFTIWDEIIDPTSINLVDPTSGVTSTGQTLNGPSRTGWVDVGEFHGGVSSDPGIGNVSSGITYTIDGASLTGTKSVTTSVDPGIANVRLATGYTIEDASLTGTLQTPTAVDGTSSTINIPNIKEQIRFALDTNNTTTSSVLDLSASMSKRVQKVLTLNPENIRPQASLFPAVCIYTDSKTVTPVTMAKDQINGKRVGKIKIQLVGMVWNDNFASNVFNDPADDDIERLMENTEKVLRHYHDLDSVVKWQIPTDVTYHSASFDEQTHFRVAFLDMEITVFY